MSHTEAEAVSSREVRSLFCQVQAEVDISSEPPIQYFGDGIVHRDHMFTNEHISTRFVITISL